MKHFYLLIILLVAACGNEEMKKVELLEEFRILAIVTTTPEAVPGAAVSLRLFVSDVKGGGRTISGTTVSCIDPGISFGAKVNCDHDPSAVTDTYDVDTTAGDLPANLFTGLAVDTLNINVPIGIFVGRSAREQFNGVGYISIFNFTVDGKSVSAFKRVVATNKVALNTNPTGSAIFLNGAAIGSSPIKDDKLVMTSSAPETFEYQTIEGDTEIRTEEMQVAWYVTKGKFDKPKSDVSETVKYLGDPDADDSLVIGIVRDERGGVEVVREFFP
jgi:hypothetical protein